VVILSELTNSITSLIIIITQSLSSIIIITQSSFTGPIFTIAWTYSQAGPLYYSQEWPGLWCAFSFFHCMTCLVYEVVFRRGDPRVVGSEENKRYIKQVEEGVLFDQRGLLPPLSSVKKGKKVN